MPNDNSAAIVIGGTSSIGRLVAVNLKDEGYSKVTITYQSRNKLAAELASDYGLHSRHLDFNEPGSENDLESLIVENKEQLKSIVFCSATTHFVQPDHTLRDFSPDALLNSLNFNLVTLYRLVVYLNTHCKRSDVHIVFIGSTAGVNYRGSNLGYIISKSSILPMIKYLTRSYGHKFRMNCVSPGLMRTEFTKQFPNEYFESFACDTPTLTLVTPKQVARVVLDLLLTDSGINGQQIVVDNGYNA